MLTVTHTPAEAKKHKLSYDVAPGLVILDKVLAETLRFQGLADEREVFATRKSFIAAPGAAAVCYRERQRVDDPGHALRLLATGRARLDPDLGASLALTGVVEPRGEGSTARPEVKPLAAFRPSAPHPTGTRTAAPSAATIETAAAGAKKPAPPAATGDAPETKPRR